MSIATAPALEPAIQEVPDVSGDIPVLELVRPLVGFPGLRRFALARLDDDGTVCDLRSLESPAVSFVVVPPHTFFPEYDAEIDEETASALGIDAPEDALVLVTVTLGATAADATANLRAPILVNHRTRLATQVIIDDPELPLKASLTGP